MRCGKCEQGREDKVLQADCFALLKYSFLETIWLNNRSLGKYFLLLILHCRDFKKEFRKLYRK
jgi:hypothetical protein